MLTHGTCFQHAYAHEAQPTVAQHVHVTCSHVHVHVHVSMCMSHVHVSMCMGYVGRGARGDDAQPSIAQPRQRFRKRDVRVPVCASVRVCVRVESLRCAASRSGASRSRRYEGGAGRWRRPRALVGGQSCESQRM